MSNRLAWGILATGSIAGTFAKGVAFDCYGARGHDSVIKMQYPDILL